MPTRDSVTRRAPQQTLPLEQAESGTCQVCGEHDVPKLFRRYGGAGMAACLECHALPSSEVAKVWLQKIRRVVER